MWTTVRRMLWNAFVAPCPRSHFASPETLQFVAFRLADSLPRNVIDDIRLHNHALPRLVRELDAGFAACWLKQASLVEGAVLYFNGERDRLLA